MVLKARTDRYLLPGGQAACSATRRDPSARPGVPESRSNCVSVPGCTDPDAISTLAEQFGPGRHSRRPPAAWSSPGQLATTRRRPAVRGLSSSAAGSCAKLFVPTDGQIGDPASQGLHHARAAGAHRTPTTPALARVLALAGLPRMMGTRLLLRRRTLRPAPSRLPKSRDRVGTRMGVSRWTTQQLADGVASSSVARALRPRASQARCVTRPERRRLPFLQVKRSVRPLVCL